MFVVTAIVISAFVLQNCNDELGLAPYVVNSVVDIINGATLPVIAFVIMLILGFVTGSFWGMAAVCFPIMLPLAEALDANTVSYTHLETEVEPLAADIDKEHRFPVETVEKMAKYGLLGVPFPTEYGGAGGRCV